MHLLRKLRGIVVTSLVWGFGWAVLGGLALSGLESVWSSLPASLDLSAPERAWGLFRAGFRLAGMLGVVAGAVFATTVAFAERRRTFATLSGYRLATWGALGGAAIPLVAATMYLAGEGIWLRGIGPFIAVASSLGALSSWAMMRLARRGDRLPALSASPDSGVLRVNGHEDAADAPRAAI